MAAAVGGVEVRDKIRLAMLTEISGLSQEIWHPHTIFSKKIGPPSGKLAPLTIMVEFPAPLAINPRIYHTHQKNIRNFVKKS